MNEKKSKLNNVINHIKIKRINIRRGKRIYHKKISKVLVFAGVNPAGARSKWPTWKKIISQSNASVWTMQETKSSEPNKLRMDNFIIYEKVRVQKGGGGVAIAARKDLNPVLTDEGEEDVEAISIDIHPSKMVISCTSAYGPQQRDSAEKRQGFGLT